MTVVGDVLCQGRVAAAAARALLTMPQMLVYPLSLATLQFAILAVLIGGALTAGGGAVVSVFVPAVAVAVAVSAVALATLMTAYCYELNEVFEGRSPTPFSGLVFALGRFKMVLAGAVLVVGSGYADSQAGTLGPIASSFGLTSAWAVKIASAFAFPAVVTSRHSLRVALANVREAIEAEWGRAVVTIVSTRFVGMAIAWSGIIVAMVLAAAAVSGTFVVDVDPFGPFVAPFVVGVSGISFAVAVQFAIRGLLQMALYRCAVDGSLPTALATDHQTLLETDSSAA